MKKLRLFNGRGWNCLGHLYVAAFSVKDAAKLSSAAYRKIHGLEDRPDVEMTSVNEIRSYWSRFWGRAMDEIIPERGVWWQKERFQGKPERII